MLLKAKSLGDLDFANYPPLMRAGRAAQRSQDTYNGRAEWLRRCRQGLHGLADPPSATVDDTRVAEFHQAKS